jgi:hypothetical protein
MKKAGYIPPFCCLSCVTPRGRRPPSPPHHGIPSPLAAIPPLALIGPRCRPSPQILATRLASGSRQECPPKEVALPTNESKENPQTKKRDDENNGGGKQLYMYTSRLLFENIIFKAHSKAKDFIILHWRRHYRPPSGAASNYARVDLNLINKASCDMRD